MDEFAERDEIHHKAHARDASFSSVLMRSTSAIMSHSRPTSPSLLAAT
jgi:hypothetical protein